MLLLGEVSHVETQQTSRSIALKRPLLVFTLHLAADAVLNPPYLVCVLLLIVSAFNLGASPSITNTSLTPIRVSDETRKNKFLDTRNNPPFVSEAHTNEHEIVVLNDGIYPGIK